MMGVPGTKQKYISHGDMGEDKPAPQHLSRLKERPGRAAPPVRAPASKEASGGGHRDKWPKDLTPGAAGIGGGQKQGPSLPVLLQLPPTYVDKGKPITLATVQAVLDAGSPMPVLLVPSLPLRRVQATFLAAEPSEGKRKRRPPGWLDGHAQEGDNDNSDEEGGAAAAAAAARPSQPIVDSKRGKHSTAVSIVHATIVDSRHVSAAGGGGGGAQYIVTILGIASQSLNEARQKAERGLHEAITSNPSSAERSPRMRASEPSAWRKERERQEDNTFQVYFGDLPSPRMIEVVRPKEVSLPSWRATTASTRHVAAGDSSDEDTSDTVFQHRHNHALERAVAAAKQWAADMARKERSSHAGHSCKPDGEGGAGEEWRHRPSELAALCYAATRQISGDTGASSRMGGSSFAGFFGCGGANRGAGVDSGSCMENPKETNSESPEDTAATTARG